MERFIYTNASGGSATIGYNDEYVLLEYEGLTAAEVVPTMTQGYRQLGYTLDNIGWGTRVITIRFLTANNDMAAVYTTRRNLQTVFNPTQKGTLIYENDVLKVAIDVFISTPLSITERLGRIQEYEIELTATYPFFRDVDETAIILQGYTGGLSFPLLINNTTFADAGSSIIVNYNGDVNGAIRAEFQDECINPTLNNLTTGEYIRVNTELENGDLLTITTGYGDKNVKHYVASTERTDDAFHLIDLGSSFFQLPQGRTKLTFTADTGTPKVILYYYQWYSGV